MFGSHAENLKKKKTVVFDCGGDFEEGNAH